MLRSRLGIGIAKLRRRWSGTECLHEQVKVYIARHEVIEVRSNCVVLFLNRPGEGIIFSPHLDSRVLQKYLHNE